MLIRTAWSCATILTTPPWSAHPRLPRVNLPLSISERSASPHLPLPVKWVCTSITTSSTPTHWCPMSSGDQADTPRSSVGISAGVWTEGFVDTAGASGITSSVAFRNVSIGLVATWCRTAS